MSSYVNLETISY